MFFTILNREYSFSLFVVYIINEVVRLASELLKSVNIEYVRAPCTLTIADTKHMTLPFYIFLKCFESKMYTHNMYASSYTSERH